MKIVYSTEDARAAKEQRKAARDARKRFEVHAYCDTHEYKNRPQWVNVGHYRTLWRAKRRAKFYEQWMYYSTRIIEKEVDTTR